MSWLYGWKYRKQKTIGASEAVADYTVTGGTNPLYLHTGVGVDDATNLYFNNKAKDYFDDIRVTADDGVTLLDYALRAATQTQAELCVKTTVGAAPITVYIYYGNPRACRGDDGFSTFIGYEHSLFTTVTTGVANYDGFPSVCKLHDGRKMAIFQRSTAHGAATGDVMFTVSSDQGRTWSAATALRTHDAGNQYGVGSISEFYNSIIGKWVIMIVFAHAPIPADANDRLYFIWSSDGGLNWGSNSPDYDNNTATIIVDLQRLNFNPAIQLSVTKGGESRPRILLPICDTAATSYIVYSTDFFASWAIITIGTSVPILASEPTLLELKDSGDFTGYIYALLRNDAAPFGFSKIISKDFGDTWGTNSPDFDDGIFTASGLTSDAADKPHIFRMNDGTAVAVYCIHAITADGEIRVVKASAEDKDITWDTANYAIAWRSRTTLMHSGDYAYPTLCNITDSVDSQIGVIFYLGENNNNAPCYIRFTWVELGSFVGSRRFNHTTTKLTSQEDNLLAVEVAASNSHALLNCSPSGGGITKYYFEGKVRTNSQGANDQNVFIGVDSPPTSLLVAFNIPENINQTRVIWYDSGGFHTLWDAYVEGVLSRFIAFIDEDNDQLNHWWYDDPYILRATSGVVVSLNVALGIIGLGSGSSAGQANCNMYWITVRKYTPTEPAWGATGSEERSPALGVSMGRKLISVGVL